MQCVVCGSKMCVNATLPEINRFYSWTFIYIIDFCTLNWVAFKPDIQLILLYFERALSQIPLFLSSVTICSSGRNSLTTPIYRNNLHSPVHKIKSRNTLRLHAHRTIIVYVRILRTVLLLAQVKCARPKDPSTDTFIFVFISVDHANYCKVPKWVCWCCCFADPR